MQTVYGFLGLIWAAVIIVLGYKIAPIWIPLIMTIVGIFLYIGLKPGIRRIYKRDGVIRTSLMLFVTQSITSYLLYGIGAALKR